MEVGVLGPLLVRDGGVEVPIPGVKERTLLAHLVARVGTVVGTDELVDSLWPDDPPRTAGKTLQAYVARLRGLVQHDGEAPLILTEGRGYRLALDAHAVDAVRFGHLAELGRSACADGRKAEAIRTFDEALSLWRGTAYGEFERTVFGRAECRRLESLALTVREDRAEAAIDLGDAASVLPGLEAHVVEHPLREHAWALLARAQAAVGDQAAALASIERAREVLADELGVDPGDELRALHARVLAQDPSLRVSSPSVPHALRQPVGMFVGRAGELAALSDEWARAMDGPGRRVAVTGPDGSGRWRTVGVLAGNVAAAGGHVVLDGTAAPGMPLLRVIDARSSRPTGMSAPAPGELQVVVGGEAFGSDSEIVLGPLSHDEVTELLRTYAPDGPSDADYADAAVDVLARSGGLAARVHDLALAWARAQVARRVEARAGDAQAATERLDGDRSALADDVERWTALRRTAEADQDACPWRGLASYEEADAPVYSGRERLTAELLARVALDRAVVLVGASGSGKSSLLRAGLLAELAGGALPGSAGWVRVVMRPGSHPMRELVHAALAGAGDTGPDRVADLLSRSLEGRGSAERLLLVVDQLEECWTTCTDAGERSAFLSTLADLATRPDARVTLVLAVRADLSGELATHPALAEALAGRSVLVAPPVERELRRVVEEPAMRAGLDLDAGLADALVEDTLREPGGLPLLSTALAELWEARDGARLTLASYVTTGGVGGAVARMAEGVYSSFDSERQAACRMLLRRLAGPGEGDAVVRRRAPLAELAALPDPLVLACVEPLAAARLLTVDDGYVEVAHEALFRSWPRLRDWLAEDSSTRDMQRRLTAAAMEWDAEHRDDALLWKGARLAAAVDLSLLHGDALTSVEQEFVEASSASLEEEKRSVVERAETATRQNRRLRLLVGGTAVGLALALVAGALAVTSRSAAVEQETAATAQRLSATALTEDYLAQRMLTAVEAVRTQDSPQTRASLLSVLQGSSQALARVEGNRFLSIDQVPGAAVAYAAENARNIVRIDLATGESRVIWSEENANPGDVHVSPDGRLIAFMHTRWDDRGNSSVDVLDATTGELVKAIPLAPPILFASFEWTAEPGRLAVATTDALWIEDVTGGAPRREIPWSPYELRDVVGMQLVGDDTLLVLESEGGVPGRLLDLITGTARPVDVGGTGVLAPDGSFVVTQPEDVGPVIAVPLAGAGGPRTITTGRQLFAGVLSPDASLLYLADETGEIAVIDMAEQGPALDTMNGHNGKVMGLALSSDGRTLWSAGRDGDAIAWDVSGDRRLERTGVLAAQATYAQRTADGALTALWSIRGEGSDANITVVDTASGDVLWGPLPAANTFDRGKVVTAFAFTPDGTTLVAAESELAPGVSWEDPDPAFVHRISVRDARTGALRGAVPVPSFVRGVAVVDGGRAAVINGAAEALRVELDDPTISMRAALPLPANGPESPAQVEVSPDGRLAALARGSEGVVVVDVASLATVSSWEMPVSDEVLAMGWLSDDVLVTGGVAGNVERRSVADGSSIGAPRRVSPGFVWDLVITDGGAAMATFGTDGDVLLWDTTSMTPVGAPLVPLGIGGRGWLDWRGDRLDVLSDSATMATYDLSLSRLMARACSVAGREPTAAEWQSMHGDEPQRPTCGALVDTDLLSS